MIDPAARMSYNFKQEAQMDDQLVAEMAKIIVKTVHPRRIILFGSQAKGSASPTSDYDFIVVSDSIPSDARYRTMAKLWRALSSFKVPKDFLIYNSAEIARWRHSKNHIIARALKEGTVIYERP